jgi:hypothetical protein
MGGNSMNMFHEDGYKQYPEQTAAVKLAETQHAPGTFCRMNPKTFRVEYVRQDGSIVPGYEHFLKAERERINRPFVDPNKYDVIERTKNNIWLWGVCETMEDAEQRKAFLKVHHPHKHFTIEART